MISRSEIVVDTSDGIAETLFFFLVETSISLSGERAMVGY